MHHYSIFFVAAATLAAIGNAQVWHPTKGDLDNFMGGETFSPDRFHPFLRRFAEKTTASAATLIKEYQETGQAKMSLFNTEADSSPEGIAALLQSIGATEMDTSGGFQPYGNSSYPYFSWLPQMVSRLIPNGPAVSWSGRCFQHTKAQATWTDSSMSALDVTFTLASPTGFLCSDTYVMMTVEGAKLELFFFQGNHTIKWDLASDITTAERWDVHTKGIRVFQFIHDDVQTIIDVLNTAAMFLDPLTHRNVSDFAAENNIYFMKNYAQVNMLKRDSGFVHLSPESVQSGDFFGIIRLDGLDPMLAWAMGSTTGHTTVALWRNINGTRSLYVCESTAVDSYWPTNGIQCTPWNQWLHQAMEADFQVVHAPLNPKYASMFNEDAAEEFFQSTKGLNYGFYNMLYGWLDTTDKNFPCLPPDWGNCLQWDFLEPAVALVGRLFPDVVDMMFLQAWNHRLGTSGLTAPEIYYEASKRGMKSVEVPTIVEDDSWRYNTTRDGKPAVGRSMVCCVFVCHMWKAGGLFESFDNEVNCGELTNWDDYALDMFATDRPPACIDADPDNPLCQVMGKYTLQLNNLNLKAPYAHMAESCPSEAPDYDRPLNCQVLRSIEYYIGTELF